jgi:hypothetical protein
MNKTQSSFEISANNQQDKLPLTINKMGKKTFSEDMDFCAFKKIGGSKLMLQLNNKFLQQL